MLNFHEQFKNTRKRVAKWVSESLAVWVFMGGKLLLLLFFFPLYCVFFYYFTLQLSNKRELIILLCQIMCWIQKKNIPYIRENLLWFIPEPFLFHALNSVLSLKVLFCYSMCVQPEFLWKVINVFVCIMTFENNKKKIKKTFSRVKSNFNFLSIKLNWGRK